MRKLFATAVLLGAGLAACSTSGQVMGGLNEQQSAEAMVGIAEAEGNPRIHVFAFKSVTIAGEKHVCGWLGGKRPNGGALGSKPWRGHFAGGLFVLDEVARDRAENAPLVKRCDEIGIDI